MQSTSTIRNAAMSYAYRGWLVVPLAGPKDPGRSPGKRPLVNAWQKAASSDEEVIAGWWDRWPDANVGVRFGPESNLIDLECDDDTQEKALCDLFGGEFPHTPTFTSRRGKHRLFRWHDDIPTSRDKAVVYVGGVGFRTGGGAKGAQSAFPPSVHEKGEVYRWIISPEDAEVATIPPEVIARICNHDGGLFGQQQGGGKPEEYWHKLMNDGVGESEGPGRNVAAAQIIGRLLHDLKDAFNSESTNRIWTTISIWNTKNRPPLGAAELRTTFDSILRRHRQQITEKGFGEAMAKYVDVTPSQPNPIESEDGKTTIFPEVVATEKRSEWRLIKVDADPVIWKLFSPLWKGGVSLSSSSLMEHRKIAVTVLEQKDFVLGPDFKVLWMGTKKEEGYLSKLVRLKEDEAAEPEQDRKCVVADALLRVLYRSRKSDTPHSNGDPTQTPDGTIWLQVGPTHQRAKEVLEGVTFEEVGKSLRNCGAVTIRKKIDGKMVAIKKLDPECIQRLVETSTRNVHIFEDELAPEG